MKAKPYGYRPMLPTRAGGTAYPIIDRVCLP